MSAEWIALTRTRNIAMNTPKVVQWKRGPLITYRNAKNDIVVVPGRCLHRGMDMSVGKVSPATGCLECPYHGWTYGPDGQYGSPFSAERQKTNVPYRFVEQDGLLWAGLNDGTPEGPPKVDAPDGAKTIWFEKVIKNSAQVVLENGIDPTHASFVHANAAGFGVYKQAPRGIKHAPNAMSFWYKPNPDVPLSVLLDIQDTYNAHAYALPYTSWSDVHVGENVLKTYVTLLPETEDRTRMFVGFARTFLTQAWFDPVMLLMGHAIVEQDRQVLERIDKTVNDHGILDPVYDVLVAGYRSRLDKCILK
jgi:phenylpropionate dioxygenase-like ring-hydroxylating dioxygenase large terminal subunit